jgi:hypothetical protein
MIHQRPPRSRAARQHDRPVDTEPGKPVRPTGTPPTANPTMTSPARPIRLRNPRASHKHAPCVLAARQQARLGCQAQPPSGITGMANAWTTGGRHHISTADAKLQEDNQNSQDRKLCGDYGDSVGPQQACDSPAAVTPQATTVRPASLPACCPHRSALARPTAGTGCPPPTLLGAGMVCREINRMFFNESPSASPTTRRNSRQRASWARSPPTTPTAPPSPLPPQDPPGG